jgi:gliding motility-associated-like protein
MRKFFLLAIMACLAVLPAFSQAPNSVAGLRLWLDGSDPNGTGTAPANGSGITTWVDKSGNNFNATSITGGSYMTPLYNASSINGKGSVRFNKDPDFVTGFNVSGLDIRATTSPDVTIFTVYKQGAILTGGDQALWGDDNGNWDRFFFSKFGGGTNGAVSQGPASPFLVSIPNAGTVGAVRLLTAVYDGDVIGANNNGPANGSAVYFNGQVVSTFTDVTQPTAAQTSLRIGLDGDDNWFGGEIAEMIVYNRKLTNCEIQTITRYLANKYGQTFATPTIAASGAGNLCPGGSVTLTSSTSTAYQWLLNNSPIGGATAVTYNATAAGNYRVIAYSEVGCTGDTSIAFTVTVTNAAASVTQPGNLVTCAGASLTPPAFTGTATSYSWTNNNIATGLAASGTGDIAAFSATNATASPIVSTVTVTPIGEGLQGFAYVPNINGNNVSVINLATGATLTTIPTAGEPYAVAVLPDHSKVFVSTITGNRVEVINTAANNITQNSPFNAPHGLVASPDGTRVYVNGWTGNAVSYIPTATPTTSTFMTNVTNPEGMAVSPDGSRLYVASSTSPGKLAVINTTTNAKVEVTLGNFTYGVAVSPDGNFVYATNAGSNTVSVINANTLAIVATITVGANPLGIAVAPNGQTIYVANANGNTVSVISAVTNTVTATLAAGTYPVGISFSPEGSRMYVTNRNSNNVSVFNATTNALVTNYAAGTNPYGLGNFVVATYTCDGTAKTFDITVNPQPSATIAYSGSPFCATGTATPTITGTTGGTFSSTAGLSINTTTGVIDLTASTAGAYTVTYTIAAANGCSQVQTTSGITINAIVNVGQPGNQTVCSGTSTTTVSFTGGTAGTVYGWTNNQPGIGLPASGNGDIAAFAATNNTSAPVTATITVTPSGGPGRAYVPNYNNSTLSVVDLSNNTIITTIALSGKPLGIAITPDLSKIYVGIYSTDQVQVIDPSTNTVVANITVGDRPYSIVSSPDGSKIYVANSIGASLSVISTATNTVVTTVPLPGNSRILSISPDGSRLFVPDGSQVHVINTSTFTLSSFAVPGSPWSTIVSRDGLKLYVARLGSSQVDVYNAQTLAFISSITVGSGPFSLALSPNGSLLYVSNNNIGTVSVVNTTTDAVSASISVGSNPQGISVSPDGSLVYVLNFASNSMSVIDAASNTVTSTVGGFSGPNSSGNFVAGIGCFGAPKTFTITVNPQPSASVSYNGSPFCATGTATPTLTGTAGGVYSSTAGLSINASTGVIDLAASTPGSYTITYAIAAGNGCNAASATAYINIGAVAAVNAVANQAVCAGSNFPGLSFTGSAGATYNWTNNDASIGLAANGTGNLPSFTATNAGNTAVTATVSVTASSSQTIPVIVPELLYYNFEGSGTSVPNLASAPPAGTSTATIMGSITQGAGSICGNSLIGSGNSATTDYLNTNWATNLTGAWTISFKTGAIPPSVTLFYIFGDINAANFRCFTNGVAGANNWILRGPFTDISAPGGAAPGVHTTTFVYDPVAANIKAYVDGALVSTVAQAPISITGAGPLKVMGYGSNVGAAAGMMLDNFALFNRALTPAEVSTLSSGCNEVVLPCTSAPQTFNITVNPAPAATISYTGSPFCATGTATPTLVGTTGGIYSSTAGLVINSATGTIDLVTSTAGNYTVTYTIAANAGCNQVQTTANIVIATTVNVDPITSQTVCAGSNTTVVNFTGTAASYNWTNNTTSIGLAASGSGNIASFTAVNGGSTPVTATITVSPVATVASSVDFNFTGASQTFTVPAGVTSIHIAGYGAQGGLQSGTNTDNKGAFAEGDLAVTPGEVLTINVGGQPTGIAGGFNGGGNGETNGVGGGGASDVRQGGSTVNDRKIVAAGGGGGGGLFSGLQVVGGAGGALTGGDGYREPNYAANPGGQGGTQVASGFGTCVSFLNPAVSGSFGTGGSVSGCGCDGYGGGGGWYGGAGSGNCRGGGGGSSYIGGVINGIAQDAIQSGSGKITISYSTPFCTGADKTFTITVNPAIPAGALDFGGGNDYAITSNNIGISGNAARTIEYWAKLTGNYEHQVNWGATGSDGQTFGTYTTGNQLQVYGWASGDYIVPNFTPDGNWHHIAVTYNGSVLKVFIDGVEKTPAGGVARTYNTADTKLVIGMREDLGTNTAPFTGRMDELRVWNRALCITEIINNMNGELTLPQSGLVAYYKMNQGIRDCINTGLTTLTDATGNHDVTLVNFALAGLTSNWVAGQVTGTAPAYTPLTSTITAGGPTTICNGSSVTLTATAGPAYQWYKDGSPIGGATNQTYIATTAGSYLVIVDPLVCAATSNSIVVSVNPVPTVDAVTSQNLCNGANTTAISFSGSVPGTVYNWTNNTTSVGLAANGSGPIASFAAVNSGITPVSALITVTPSFTSGGTTCVGTQGSFSITVNPTPTVNTVADQTVCNNAPTAAVTFSGAIANTNYSWTNSNSTIGLASAGTGNIPSFTGLNATNAPITATITVTPAATLSGLAYVPNNGSGTVTVIDLTTGTVVGAPIAVGANPFGVTVLPDHSKVYVSNTGGNSVSVISTATNTVTGTSPFNQPHGLVASPDGTKVYVNGWTGNAVSAINTGTNVSSFMVNVNNPEGMAVSANGTRLYVASSTNPGNLVVINTTNNSIVATIPVGNFPQGVVLGGDGSKVYVVNNGSATVSVINTANNAVTATIPVGSNPLAAAISPDGTKLYVTNSGNNNVSVINTATNAITTSLAVGSFPYGIAVAPDGSVVYVANRNSNNVSIINTATNVVTSVAVGTAPIALGSFTTGSLQCAGAPKTFTITVNPTPTVDAVANQTVCNGAATTAVSFGGTVTGTVFNWTNNNAAIGLAVSGTGNILSFNATNTTNAPITGTITVTPVFTNGGTSCSGTPQTFTITVNPTPTANAVTSQVLCSGSNTAAINFSGAVAGTVYNWTNSNTAIGLASTGTGNIGAFAATNTTATVQTATVTVTPSFTNGGQTCSGTPVTFTITANPIPTVDAVSNQTVCNNATTSAVSFVGTVTGTVFNWTNTAASIGLAANGTGNIASFTATNAGTAPVTATISITPSFTNGGQTCSGTPGSFTITVNPSPAVTPDIATQTVCTGAPTTAINFSTTATGGTTSYSWANTNTSIGLGANGSGNIASFTATNSSSTVQTATITITPTFINGAICSGPAVTVTIAVNPVPTVATVANQSLCSGLATTAVAFSGAVTGTIFNWTNNTTSIGLGAGGAGNIPSFTAANATASPVTATISVTPSFTNGGTTCTGTAGSFTITVNPLPTGTITAPSGTLICQGSTTPLQVSGGTSYQWSLGGIPIGGATGATYNASLPGVYSATITNSFGCTQAASNTITLTLVQKPRADFTFNTYCLNLPVQFNNTTSTVGSGTVTYAWTFGDGSTSTVTSPTHTYTQVGNFQVRLIASPNGCTAINDTITKTISIEAPLAGLRLDPQNVIAGRPTEIHGRNLANGHYSWTPVTGLSNPFIWYPIATVTLEQDYRIQVTFNSGCVTVDSLLVRIFSNNDIYVPTAFSPDGDGVNDVLRPITVGIVSFRAFHIYDRLGREIFLSTSINQGWDGTLRGQKLPSETYVWVAEGMDSNNQLIRRSGQVLLVR